MLFRRPPLEVLLAHPGGPFWAARDAGAWTIPKGQAEPNEDLLETARREMREEVGALPDGPFIELGAIQQKAGKVVHAWACEGDFAPDQIQSNLVSVEWPRGSGRRRQVPEVDRVAWFDLDCAREKINPAQAELLDRLCRLLEFSDETRRRG